MYRRAAISTPFRIPHNVLRGLERPFMGAEAVLRFDKRLSLKTIIVLCAINLCLGIAYLAAILGLVHDEKYVREKTTVASQLEEHRERLTARFFGSDTLDRLRSDATQRGLVPIGQGTYVHINELHSIKQALHTPL